MKLTIILRSFAALLTMGIPQGQACEPEGIEEFMQQHQQRVAAAKKPSMLANFPEKPAFLKKRPTPEEPEVDEDHDNESSEDPIDPELANLLFNNHGLRTGKRILKATLPSHLRIRLQVCSDNIGKGPAELGRLFNAAVTAEGFTDLIADDVMLDFFRGYSARNQLTTHEDGKLTSLTDKGIRVLELLSKEEETGNVQQAKEKRKYAVTTKSTNKKPKTQINHPEHYIVFLQALDRLQGKDLDGIRETMRAQQTDRTQEAVKKMIKQIKARVNTCLDKDWIRQVPGTVGYVITDKGTAQIQILQQQLTDKELPPPIAVQEVDISRLQNPVMYLRLLETGQDRQDFMSVTEFYEKLKEKSEELPSMAVVRDDYLRPMTEKFGWFERKFVGHAFLYKVIPHAVEVYLQSLREAVETKLLPKSRIKKKLPRKSSNSDIEEVFDDDELQQGDQKRGKK